MIEKKHNFIEVIKHVLTHKSLVKFGYKLMIVRLLYAMIYPIVLIFKILNHLVNFNKKEDDYHDR